MANEKNSEDALEELRGANCDEPIETAKKLELEQKDSSTSASRDETAADDDIDGRDFELSDADWVDESVDSDPVANESLTADENNLGGTPPEKNEASSEGMESSGVSSPPISIRKLYGLPIDEIEGLLAKQQEVQAQTFKIVRHLRAAEDKIALIKKEKLTAVEDLAEAREEIELFKNECTEFQKRLQESQVAKVEADRRLQSQDVELLALREQIDQMRANHLKQQAEQVTLLEGFKTKLTEYGNIREQLHVFQQQSQREQNRIAELTAELSRFQQQEGALQEQLKGAADERADLLKLIKAAMVRLERKDSNPQGKSTASVAPSPAAVKPADVKPAAVKPAAVKPAAVKPAAGNRPIQQPPQS